MTHIYIPAHFPVISEDIIYLSKHVNFEIDETECLEHVENLNIIVKISETI